MLSYREQRSREGEAEFERLCKLSPKNLASQVVEKGERIAELEAEVSQYKSATDSFNRLVREIDIILSGEDGAAKQASLCDLMGQIRLAQRWKDAGEWLFLHTGSILAGSMAGHHEAIVYIGSMRKRVSSVRDTPLEAIEALRREVDDE